MAAASNIKITIPSSGYWSFTPSSSDCQTYGIYHTGTFTLTYANEDDIAYRTWVLCDSSKNALKAYRFENGGGTVSLSEMFPGYELIGGYLGNQSQGFYYPIVAGYTACGAPTACAVNDTLSTGNVTLSWSGAKDGTENAITGYEIQYRDSIDGSSWGSWTALKTVASTSTSASLSVSPPSTAGNYRQFRVRTQGTAGSAYYSGWKESTNTLRRDHAALAGFTDSTLTAGTTPIKAIHMTELQNRVNTLRTFYGLSTYGFTTITAGTTKLSGWTSHVNEIRTAIDQVCTASGKSHETWISFTVNCPRADVIKQLRDVVLSL